MDDAHIVSDIHLFNSISNSQKFLNFLHYSEDRTHKIIVNGDLFDNTNFQKATANDWKIIDKLKDLASKKKIIYIKGNHDPSEIAEIDLQISQLNFYILRSGKNNIFCTHGDQFDQIIQNNPLVAKFSEKINELFYHCRLNSLIKPIKTRILTKLQLKHAQKALDFCEEINYNTICVGHTHLPSIITRKDSTYVNSGSWTERQNSFISVKNGSIFLHDNLF